MNDPPKGKDKQKAESRSRNAPLHPALTSAFCLLPSAFRGRSVRYTTATMSLPRRIAWRYLRRPTDRLVSAVGIVSVFGLVIGGMAPVISMALMTGYRGDLQQKLLGRQPADLR